MKTDLSEKAIHSAVYWQNRCCELEEVIEQFCMDADAAAQPVPIDFETWHSSEDRLKDAPKKEYPVTHLGMEALAKDCMRIGWQAAIGIAKGGAA